MCVKSIKGAVLYKLYISDEMWWIWVTGGTWAEFKVLQQSIWILQSTSTSCFTVWVTPECRSHTESESIKSSPAWTTITCCSALFLITGCFSKEKILTGTKSLNMIRGEITETNPPAPLLKSVLQSCGALCWQQLSLTSCPVQNQIKPSQVSPTATPEPDFVQKVNKLTSESFKLAALTT